MESKTTLLAQSRQSITAVNHGRQSRQLITAGNHGSQSQLQVKPTPKVKPNTLTLFLVTSNNEQLQCRFKMQEITGKQTGERDSASERNPEINASERDDASGREIMFER